MQVIVYQNPGNYCLQTADYWSKLDLFPKKKIMALQYTVI